jgi:hypothetical protein
MAGGVAILAVGRGPTTVSVAPTAICVGETDVYPGVTGEGVEEVVGDVDVPSRIERTKVRARAIRERST